MRAPGSRAKSEARPISSRTVASRGVESRPVRLRACRSCSSHALHVFDYSNICTSSSGRTGREHCERRVPRLLAIASPHTRKVVYSRKIGNPAPRAAKQSLKCSLVMLRQQLLHCLRSFSPRSSMSDAMRCDATINLYRGCGVCADIKLRPKSRLLAL